MTLAKDGTREIILLTILFGGATAALAWFFWPAAIVTGLVWLGGLAFFRVPHVSVPRGDGLLVSPASGTVSDITPIEHDEFIGGRAQRIGIFLSVFDVHVNRAPCDGRVRLARHKPGEFLDARHQDASQRNEANTLVIDPTDGTPGPLVVRQIAGLIARRIVCRAQAGDALRRGDLYGLIKFGSRTELIVPAAAGLEAAVLPGQKVRGGETVLMRRARRPDDKRGDAPRPAEATATR